MAGGCLGIVSYLIFIRIYLSWYHQIGIFNINIHISHALKLFLTIESFYEVWLYAVMCILVSGGCGKMLITAKKRENTYQFIHYHLIIIYHFKNQ